MNARVSFKELACAALLMVVGCGVCFNAGTSLGEFLYCFAH